MTLDRSIILAVVFDCVNTVFDVSSIDSNAYIHQVAKANREGWKPLDVDMAWLKCPAHPDSAEGTNRLNSRFVTATCSNWPAWVLASLSQDAGILWSAIVPMETVQVYKPSRVAYLNVPQVLGITPANVLFVTANERAPDLEMARSLGMQAVLIDRERKYPDGPHTITDLAEILGC